jgi:hypothetical protein
LKPTVADIILMCAALAAGVMLVASARDSGDGGGSVVIRSMRDTTVVVGLSEERTLTVRGVLGDTVIHVGGGRVEFVSSPCPHKVCIERGPVSARGDYIVCVPNGVSATITGKSDFDAIVP